MTYLIKILKTDTAKCILSMLKSILIKLLIALTIVGTAFGFMHLTAYLIV